MKLDVDTGAYAGAEDLMYAANHGVTDQMAHLAALLDGCDGMSGTDAGGRSWAESYDAMAGPLLRAGADLGGSLGATANLLNASLVNHEGAERGASLFPEAVGGSDRGGRGSERLTPGDLPSAFGGLGNQPAGWQWLAEHLEGLLWPDADTGSMRGAGAAWLDAASSLEGWSTSAGDAAALMESQRSPDAPIAARAVRELGSHGAELAAACRDVGHACADYAGHVEESHAEVVGICRELLAWTAVDQATGVVLSFFTGGGAEVAAQLVESGVMAKYAARVVAVLRRLVELARAAAALISRGLARVTEILARLKVFLSLRTTRALERAGVTIVGRRALERLSPELREQVEEALDRARMGKIRFPGHDDESFENHNLKYRLPSGTYIKWDVAASQAKRGAYRVLIEGDVKHPNAIYLWDHVRPPVRIGP